MATPMAEPPHLAANLKTLCLSTMAVQWRPLAEQATRARQAPADYLAQLAHLEVTGRQERRIQRRMQEARFPMLKTLDAFSFDAQPGLGRDAVLQVFGCRFVAEAANVVLVGGVGTGKTHLAIALGMACCQHDYRVRFLTAAELVTLLGRCRGRDSRARHGCACTPTVDSRPPSAPRGRPPRVALSAGLDVGGRCRRTSGRSASGTSGESCRV